MSSESSTNAGSRASNIQKILDRKQKIFQLPRTSKMVKISTYSTCEVGKSRKTPSIIFVHGAIFFTPRKKTAGVGDSSSTKSSANVMNQITVLRARTCAPTRTVHTPSVSLKYSGPIRRVSTELSFSETCVSPRESNRRCLEQAIKQYRKSDFRAQ